MAAIFPNPSDKGGSREAIYSEFLKKHLPSSCNILLGGFLFDLQGNESKQLDVIITNNTCLRYRLPVEDSIKEFACTEGSLGVVSIKSDLDARNLIDCLKNLASIPPMQSLEGRINPVYTISNYEDWPYKIVYAHKGNSIEGLCNSLNEYYINYPDIPITRRPNLIHVNGQGYILRISAGGNKTRNGKILVEHTFYPMNDTTNVYALMDAINKIQTRCVASSDIITTYSSMIDNIHFN